MAETKGTLTLGVSAVSCRASASPASLFTGRHLSWLLNTSHVGEECAQSAGVIPEFQGGLLLQLPVVGAMLQD